MLRRLFYDAKIRDIVWQVLFVAGLIATITYFVRNASQNLVNAGIASGFDFLWRTAGIQVPFVLTGYTPDSNNLALLWVGIVNTILISLLAMVASTLLGFIVGLARLSNHKLLAGLAGAYVEFVRNIPLLFFVLFWYFGVIAALPAPRQSISLGGLAFLNNRGLTIPLPLDPEPVKWAIAGAFVSIIIYFLLTRYAAHKREREGKAPPMMGIAAIALCILVPVMVLVGGGLQTGWDVPRLQGFNYRGGFVLIPEFVALFAALTTYTAAFTAEIVRGGVEAVTKGQREAASALGLTRGQSLKLVIVPQALRVIIPPMTSQYLNVLKNSSFGAAIAYPDIVSVFMGSALNNTGQAIEIIAITLGFYLAAGLAVSAFMNWYNARTKLVTR